MDSGRIRFCSGCDAEMPWDAAKCYACGHLRPSSGHPSDGRTPLPDTAGFVSVVGLGVGLMLVAANYDGTSPGAHAWMLIGVCILSLLALWWVIRSAVTAGIRDAAESAPTRQPTREAQKHP